MADYSVTSGADYRLFATLAALSYRVTSLELVLFTGVSPYHK